MAQRGGRVARPGGRPLRKWPWVPLRPKPARENSARQTSRRRRPPPHALLPGPRPAQWTSSPRAACSTMCSPEAATPSERVCIARPTSLRGLPVWPTWRRRPMVRGPGPADFGEPGTRPGGPEATPFPSRPGGGPEPGGGHAEPAAAGAPLCPRGAGPPLLLEQSQAAPVLPGQGGTTGPAPERPKFGFCATSPGRGEAGWGLASWARWPGPLSQIGQSVKPRRGCLGTVACSIRSWPSCPSLSAPVAHAVPVSPLRLVRP